MEEWSELESDPGLFSLLLEDFGVKGVQVEEVYDIQTNFEGPVYGFIFLFKWIEERRARRKVIQDEENYVMDDQSVNSMFFAKQIINNSCATHALISVLLNYDNLDLGPMLTKLKHFTNNMNPDDKGYAIGNMPDLARAHNSHSRPEPYRMPEKQREGISVRTGDAFHFVSYVPINNHLFELDGLKPYPIDHGPWSENEDWTDYFRKIIAARLGGEPYNDIRFNLMSVVPDKRVIYNQKLNTLKMNRQIIVETLQQMVKVSGNMETKAEPNQHESTFHHWNNTNEGFSDISPKYDPSMNSPSSLPSVRSSARLRNKGSAYSSAFAVSTTFSSTPATQTENSTIKEEQEEGYNKVAVKIENEDTDSDVDIMEDNEASKISAPSNIEQSDSAKENDVVEKKQLQSVENSDVKFHISVVTDTDGSVKPTTLATTDVTKPLSIQTKFGYLPSGPGTGSSTDTASEVGSALSSPVCSTGQPSPNVFKASPNSNTDPRLLGIKQESPQMLHKITPRSAEKRPGFVGNGIVKGELTSGSESGSPEIQKAKRRRFTRNQGFSPKDLIQLLKNVESEIEKCEHNLNDEVEKTQKYRDDDQRRTHNYDQFIITFLSMLAEQGKLTDLVQGPLKKRSLSSSSKKNGKKAKAKKR